MSFELDRKFTQEYIVYAPKEQGVYLIQETEWARLKKQVQALPAKSRTFERWSFVLVGTALTSLLQLLTAAPDSTDEPGLLVAVISIFVISVILSIVLYYVSKQQRDEREIRANEILDEMNEIEQRFNPSS